MSKGLFESNEAIELIDMVGQKIRFVVMAKSRKDTEAMVINSRLGKSIGQEEVQDQIWVYIAKGEGEKKFKMNFSIEQETVSIMKSKFIGEDLKVVLILKSRKIYIISLYWDSAEETYNPSIWTFEGHLNSITSAYIYGSTLITSSLDQSVIIWDISYGIRTSQTKFMPQLAAIFDHYEYGGHPSAINCMIVSHIRKYALISDSVGFLKIFDIGKISKILKAKKKYEKSGRKWQRRNIWEKSILKPYKMNNFLVDITFKNDDIILAVDLNHFFFVIALDYKKEQFSVLRLFKVDNWEGSWILSHRSTNRVTFVGEKRSKTEEIFKEILKEKPKGTKEQLKSKEYFVPIESSDQRVNFVGYVHQENPETSKFSIRQYL